MSVQAEAKRQISEQKLIDEELGKRTLRGRLKRFLQGKSNLANVGKERAVLKERLKLAKELRSRRVEREKKKAKRKRRHQ